ncbi:MAG: hypothetical protein RR359_00995 [Bacilli bacterium]
MKTNKKLTYIELQRLEFNNEYKELLNFILNHYGNKRKSIAYGPTGKKSLVSCPTGDISINKKINIGLLQESVYYQGSNLYKQFHRIVNHLQLEEKDYLILTKNILLTSKLDIVVDALDQIKFPDYLRNSLLDYSYYLSRFNIPQSFINSKTLIKAFLTKKDN